MEDLDVAPYFSAYFPDDAVLRSPPADLWAAGAIHPRAMLVGGTSKDGTAAFYGTAPTLGNIAPDPVCSPGEAAFEQRRRAPRLLTPSATPGAGAARGGCLRDGAQGRVGRRGAGSTRPLPALALWRLGAGGLRPGGCRRVRALPAD